MDLLDSKQSEADHVHSDVCGGHKAMTIGIVLGEGMTLRNAWDRFESENISPQQRDLGCWYKDHVGNLPTFIANLHT